MSQARRRAQPRVFSALLIEPLCHVILLCTDDTVLFHTRHFRRARDWYTGSLT
jgi:hypothetical protein